VTVSGNASDPAIVEVAGLERHPDSEDHGHTHGVPRFQPKVLVLSHALPPSPSGQATVLYRLLGGVEPDSYCLVSGTKNDFGSLPGDPAQRLLGRHWTMEPVPQLRDFSSPIVARIASLANHLLRVVLGARQLRRIADEEGCETVLACTGDPFDLPVACLASRLSRMNLYLYYFDYYSEQWAGTQYHRFAERVEGGIVRRADGIFVPNEGMQEELADRYGVSSKIVRNPVDTRRAGEMRAFWPTQSTEIRIVYTGSIYRAQADAFKTLLRSLSILTHLNVRLHLYTAQTGEDLRRQSIVGPFVLHPHASPSEIEIVQAEADLLYLPLSFDRGMAKVIDTSSPGKMGEYLASGRPILVHAPPSSFVNRYFREHGCGVVVDQDDRAELARAIERLIGDEELRTTIVGRALETSRIEFSPDSGRRALLDSLNSQGSNHATDSDN
jgi:glycosyltransferase involved in cell wall biosynthesis